MTTVARWRSTSSRKGSKANRGNVTTVAPEVSALVERDDEAHDVGEGRDGGDGVARPELQPGARLRDGDATFAWVSMTPLGRPVVPLE